MLKEAALAAILVASPALAQAPRCVSGESVTRFGEWFSPGVSLDAGQRRQNDVVPALRGAAAPVAVRLQLAVSTPAGADWKLVLRDPQLRVLAIVESRDFAPGAVRQQWTGRLEAAQVSAELLGDVRGARIGFAAGMALPSGAKDVNVYSISGAAPNWRDLYEAGTATVQRQQGESVGMMVSGAVAFPPSGPPAKATWCCSGAMLTADIYITNWHCGGTDSLPDAAHWTSEICANTVLDLGWDEGNRARRQYACTAVLHRSKTLDYALLRVSPVTGPGAATGRANPVVISAVLPADDSIFIVHHAQCLTKKVSAQGCSIDNRAFPGWTSTSGASEISYTCDTEPGASGAPVFDAAGRMIALHHLGHQKRAGGPDCPVDAVNKGIGMASILADLAASRPDLLAELPPR